MLANGAVASTALSFDRAIFTSLPSNTGEGYRLVAWSAGVRPEERQELTRRAPSHGALAGGDQAVFCFHLQTTKRFVLGLVRVAGAEHTRRGGGRVWTDFVLCDGADARRHAWTPEALREALAAEPLPKPPLGSSPLSRVEAPAFVLAQPGSPVVAPAALAGLASLLAGTKICVVAAGSAATTAFEQAMSMLPAALREGVDACGGLRFSPSRGVRVTVTDAIDQETVRATRGQKVECIDLAAKPPVIDGPLAAWFGVMARWWSEDRALDAVDLAARMTGACDIGELQQIAQLCDSIDRREAHPAALGERLARRSAA
jgi:hypothetical protein